MRSERKGKEFYSEKYGPAVRMFQQGIPVSRIASELGMSYSAVYHWVRGLRKPGSGNVAGFLSHLRKNGPCAAADLKEIFAKHNELFLIASRRGLPVKRYMIQKKFGEYSTWYYVEGQEKELEMRIGALMQKIKDVKNKLSSLAG
jgi:hypothetical protein